MPPIPNNGKTILYGTIYVGDMSTEIEAIARALGDFITRANRTMNRAMGSDGVSVARLKLLTLIAREQPARSADLMAALSYSPRTMTEAIDALEREGLIDRTPDPTDRRAKRISITPRGEAAIEASAPIRTRFLQEVFGPLSEEERALLLRILEQLNERVQTFE